MSASEPAAAPARYPGPVRIESALSRLVLSDGATASFTRDGPRADVEYRDLGWSAATGGAIGARHIRAIVPFAQETGWHWHDMRGHFVILLRGWITFRYAGVPEPVTVRAGGTLSQPAGVAHNVVARSDDMELIEVNMPAQFGLWDLPGFDPGPQAAAPEGTGSR